MSARLEGYYAAVASGELEPDSPVFDVADWWQGITAPERAYWLAMAARANADAQSIGAAASVDAWRAFCEHRYARAWRAWDALTRAERSADVATVAQSIVARFPELSLSSARFLAARFRAEDTLELEHGDVAAGDADPVDFCFWCPRCREPRDACTCKGPL